MRLVLLILTALLFNVLVTSQDFDFTPGNETIFVDSVNYKIGDVPSMWKVLRGTIEVQDFDGNKVIRCVSMNGNMVAKLPVGYEMPQKFTIEFDAYFDKNKGIDYEIGLWDENKKLNTEEKLVKRIRIYSSKSMAYTGTNASAPKSDTFETGWRRISISYDQGKVKTYIDTYRILNIADFPGKVSGITFFGIHSSDYPCMIKNFSFKGFSATNTTPVNSGSMGN